MARPAFLPVLALSVLPGCVLGSEQSPGCRVDHPGDCDPGWSCQAGVCVRPTTGLTQPEAGAQSDGASDATPEAAADVEPEAQGGGDASEDVADAQQADVADAQQADVADAQQADVGVDGPVEASDGAAVD